MLISMSPLDGNAAMWEDYEWKHMIRATDTKSRQVRDGDRQANDATTKTEREKRTSRSQDTTPASELQASKRGHKSASLTAYDVEEGPTTTTSDLAPRWSFSPLPCERAMLSGKETSIITFEGEPDKHTAPLVVDAPDR